MSNQEEDVNGGYDEVYEMYREIYHRQNNQSLNHYLASDVLSFGEPLLDRLEKFIESIVNCNALIFAEQAINEFGRKIYSTQLNASFLNLDLYLRAFSDKYVYSERVQLFFDVCKEMGIIKERFIDSSQPSSIVRKPSAIDKPKYFTQAEIYDDLVSNIFESATSDEFAVRIKLRERVVNKEFNKAKRYVDSCFNQFEKLCVLRMDLWFKTQLLGRSGNLETLREYFSVLTDELNGHQIPRGVVGFLAKLEYGKSKGYFIHLVLLLDGSTFPVEESWIEQVRAMWVRITNNSGNCLNSNHEYAGFSLEKGVRLIGFGQTDKREAFDRWVLGYLAKSMQYLAPKVNKGDQVLILGKSYEGSARKVDLTKNILSFVKTDRSKVKLTEAEALYSEILSLRSIGAYSYVYSANPYTKEYLFVLLQVERFVIALQHDARDAFDVSRDEDNKFTYTHNPIGSFLLEFGDLEKFKKTIENTRQEFKIEFSVYVDVFYMAIDDLLEEIELRKWLRDPRRGSVQERKTEDKVYIYNKFVNFVRIRLADSATRKSSNTRNSRASDKFKDACAYVDSLFTKCGDLYVLSLNLYPINVNGNQTPVSTKVGLYPQLLGKFFSNGKHHRCLSGMAGFIGKWEYTSERGVYARVIIFLEATKVSNEKHDQLIDSISHYWIDEITKGSGRYDRSSITQDMSFTNQTFFQVQRKNSKLRKILKSRVVGYLAKSDLYVKETNIPMKNVFFRGDLPVKKLSVKTSLSSDKE